MVEPRKFEENPPSFAEKMRTMQQNDPKAYSQLGYQSTGEIFGDAWGAYKGYREGKSKESSEALGLMGRIDWTKEEEQKVMNFVGESFDPLMGGGVKSLGPKKILRAMAKSTNPIDKMLISDVQRGKFTVEDVSNLYRGLRGRNALGETPGQMFGYMRKEGTRKAIPGESKMATLAEEGKYMSAEARRRLEVWDYFKVDKHLPRFQESLEGVSNAKAAIVWMKPETYFNALARGTRTGKQEIHSVIRKQDPNSYKIDIYAEHMDMGDKFPLPVLEKSSKAQGGGWRFMHEGRHRTIAAAIRHGAEEIPVVVMHSGYAKNPATALRRFGKHEAGPPRKTTMEIFDTELDEMLMNTLGKTRGQATQSELEVIAKAAWEGPPAAALLHSGNKWAVDSVGLFKPTTVSSIARKKQVLMSTAVKDTIPSSGWPVDDLPSSGFDLKPASSGFMELTTSGWKSVKSQRTLADLKGSELIRYADEILKAKTVKEIEKISFKYGIKPK